MRRVKMSARCSWSPSPLTSPPSLDQSFARWAWPQPACTMSACHGGTLHCRLLVLFRRTMVTLRSSSIWQLLLVTICIEAQHPGQYKFADVVFLLDGSDDVSVEDFSHMKTIAQALMNIMQIGQDGFRVGLTVYGGDANVEFSLNTHNSLKSAQRALLGAPKSPGRPRLGHALHSLRNDQFAEAAGSRSHLGHPQVLIILTASDSTDDVTRHSKKLKDDGVVVFVLGAGKAKLDELQLAGSFPAQTFVYFHRDFAGLMLEMHKMVHELAEVFQLSIEIQGKQKADVVFLLDGSEDGGQAEFQQMKGVVEVLLGVMNIHPNIVRVGLVQYGHQPRSEFYLNTYEAAKGMQVAIKNIQPLGGPSNLHEGLALLRREQFVERSGGRAHEGAIQVAIVLAGSKFQADPLTQAAALHSDGVKIYALGTGQATVDQLDFIASQPVQSYRFYQRDVSDIFLLLPLLGKKLGEALGVSIDIQLIEGGPDIVLLLDGSSDVGPSNFELIRLLASQVIAGLDIGLEQTHVAVVQYASTARTEFNLNDFTSKDSAVNAVMSIAHLSGRSDLAAGLQHVQDNILVKEKGGRRDIGAPQFVFILTGSSPDNLEAAKKASKALQDKGVMVVAAGAGSITEGELKEFVSDPEDKMAMYHGSSYKGMEGLSVNLLSDISTALANRKSVKSNLSEVDVVFLLDGDGGHAEFRLMKKMVEVLLEVIHVHPISVRIGLAQYGQQARSEFYLNTYGTAGDIQVALQHIQPLGGPSNLQEGLELLRQKQFVEESGGRAKQGATQIAIVLAASEIQFDPRSQAAALHRDGVKIFALGTAKATADQLDSVASQPTPSHLFHLPDISNFYTVLPEIGRKLGQVIGVPIEIQIVEGGPDVIILLDGSSAVGPSNFESIRLLASQVISGLDIEPQQTNVAVVQYASTAQTEFNLNAFTSKDSAVNAVMSIAYLGGRSDLAAGLQHVQDNIMLKEKGGRSDIGAPQVVLILIGSSPYNLEATKRASKALQDKGVIVLAVGAGSITEVELKEFVSAPENKMAMYLGSGYGGMEGTPVNILSDISTALADRKSVQLPSAVDLVFLLDGSHDIALSDFDLMKHIVETIVGVLDVGQDKTQVGMVQYGGQPRSEFYLNTYRSNAEITDALQNFTPKGGQSNLGEGLELLRRDQFVEGRGGRAKDGATQVAIILAGTTSEDDPTAVAKVLQESGVNIYALGVRKASRDQLLRVGTQPTDRFVYHKQDYFELAYELPKLGSSLGDLLGTSIAITVVTTVSITGADVVLLLDGSDAVGLRDFKHILQLAAQVTRGLNVATQETHVAVVQYGSTPRTEFNLVSHTDEDHAVRAIESVEYKLGRSDLAAGLRHVQENVLVEREGGRGAKGTPQVVIILTGSSPDDLEAARKVSNALQVRGVTVMAVGAGNAKPHELQALVSEPAYKMVIYQPSFEGFGNLSINVQNSIIQAAQPLIPEASDECVKAEKADIVFLVDVSWSVGMSNFQLIRDFIIALIKGMVVGKDRVRIGLAQYSTNPQMEFHLKNYHTKDEILEYIRNWKYKGGNTFTGAALEFLTWNHFTEEAGSRRYENVPQVAVLITDGVSQDDMVPPAEVLKASGVMLYAIGIAHAPQQKLEEAASWPSDQFVYMADNFEDLNKISAKLLSSLCSTIENVKKSQQGLRFADVVFLLDGSSSARGSFDDLRNGARKIIETLKIGKDQVHVGMTQYGGHSRTEFLLQRYYTKADVLVAVNKMKPGGGPPNLSQGLTILEKEHFVETAGSRKNLGYRQIAIIMSATSSQSEILGKAWKLWEQGIIIIPIGPEKV
uniref:collagen alpha-3(VI) chain-like isoform X1 n=2 Tax=Myxine glutinosa TaxID=7769 RepID=UPI00358E329F